MISHFPYIYFLNDPAVHEDRRRRATFKWRMEEERSASKQVAAFLRSSFLFSNSGADKLEYFSAPGIRSQQKDTYQLRLIGSYGG
jgi:hypothetical protein